MCIGLTAQSFTVSFPKEAQRQAARWPALLLLSSDDSAEPRMQIDDTPKSQMIFGVTVDGLEARCRP
jgi:hypothetical protein